MTYTDKFGYLRDRYGELIHRQVAFEYYEAVWEEKFDLPFSEYEVHHINSEKQDNIPENLYIVLPEDHKKIHREQKRVRRRFKTHNEIDNFLSPKERKSYETPYREDNPLNYEPSPITYVEESISFSRYIIILLLIVLGIHLVVNYESKDSLPTEGVVTPEEDNFWDDLFKSEEDTPAVEEVVVVPPQPNRDFPPLKITRVWDGKHHIGTTRDFEIDIKNTINEVVEFILSYSSSGTIHEVEYTIQPLGTITHKGGYNQNKPFFEGNSVEIQFP